jgi:hypothetical protein
MPRATLSTVAVRELSSVESPVPEKQRLGVSTVSRLRVSRDEQQASCFHCVGTTDGATHMLNPFRPPAHEDSCSCNFFERDPERCMVKPRA